MRFITRLYRNLKWRIAPYLNPRQKWLTRQIPREWMDKCDLIPLCLFNILVDFVENEDHNLLYDYKDASADGVINDAWVSERIEMNREILAVYEYIVKERNVLMVQFVEAHPEFVYIKMDGPLDLSTYKEAYKEVRRLEKVVSDKDTWAMTTIVKHRDYLWT